GFPRWRLGGWGCGQDLWAEAAGEQKTGRASEATTQRLAPRDRHAGQAAPGIVLMVHFAPSLSLAVRVCSKSPELRSDRRLACRFSGGPATGEPPVATKGNAPAS